MDLLKNLDNMEEIPTAEEYLKRMLKMGMSSSEIMKGFAKRHTENALKEASKVLDTNTDADYVEHPTKERILNSYLLNKIK